MEPDEIEKLKAKVAKDNTSSLFLPLAEEYRKAGKLDEAISAIKSGLEHQPGYTSARVALGRIYLEKGMLNEAKAEFERVIPVIPDNLFAHKKLAEIYKETGESEKAIAEYRLIINLNPTDEDARASLEKLNSSILRQPGPIQQKEAPVEGLYDLTGGPGDLPVSFEPLIEPQGPLTGKDFDEFKSFFSEDNLNSETISDRAADVGQDSAPDSATVEQDFEDFLRSAVEAVPEPSLMSASDFVAEAIEKTEAVPGLEAVPAVSGVPDILSIDSLVAAGEYHKALEAYNLVLTKEPENRHVLQRVMELKAFLKMTGKGEDTLIAKLDGFLEAIKKGMKKTDELPGGIVG